MYITEDKIWTVSYDNNIVPVNVCVTEIKCNMFVTLSLLVQFDIHFSF